MRRRWACRGRALGPCVRSDPATAPGALLPRACWDGKLALVLLPERELRVCAGPAFLPAVSTGAVDDIRRATELAYKAVSGEACSRLAPGTCLRGWAAASSCIDCYPGCRARLQQSPSSPSCLCLTPLSCPHTLLSFFPGRVWPQRRHRPAVCEHPDLRRGRLLPAQGQRQRHGQVRGLA